MGLFSLDLGKASIGVIFRNSQGMVVNGFCSLAQVSANSSFMVEALALQKALSVAF